MSSRARCQTVVAKLSPRRAIRSSRSVRAPCHVKMKYALLVLLPLLGAGLAAVVHREPAWSHSTLLDAGLGHGHAGYGVRLSWRPRDRYILFQLEAPTLGYVGLGFSQSGGMPGADIIVAWVDDATGRPHLLVGISRACHRHALQGGLRRIYHVRG